MGAQLLPRHVAGDGGAHRQRAVEMWAKYQKFDEQNARVEVVDLFHFLISLAQVLGMSADDVFNAYCKKNEVNFKRQDSGYAQKDHEDSGTSSEPMASPTPNKIPAKLGVGCLVLFALPFAGFGLLASAIAIKELY